MRQNIKKFIINLSEFKFIDKLGAGAYGCVFLVENINTHQQYALKQIAIIEEGDYDVSRKCELITREISIMARIQHPSIVQFYGFNLSQSDNKASILMQYAPMGTLKSILNDIWSGEEVPGYDNTARQKILIGIARGMQYLHKNHIIHRDLKPDNILIDGNFNPLITDFGYAKIINNSTADTIRIGTPLYEAPELLKGDCHYTGKVDVYSFGILMYEIVTNEQAYIKLFRDKKVKSGNFANQVFADNLRPVFYQDINPDIKELIEKCWSGDQSERPTFDEIFEKLTYGPKSSVYDNLFNDDKPNPYFLDNVDSDEVLNYADYLIERENTAVFQLKQMINEMKQQIESIKQDSELQLNEIKLQFQNLKDGVTAQISQLPTLKQSRTQKPLFLKSLKFNEGQNFNGIIHYLTQKVGSNIHDSKSIKITTNSKHVDDSHFFFKDANFYHPKNLVDFDKNNEYKSNDEGGAIICFDFKEKLVQIQMYELTSSNKVNNSANLKNWNLEVSKDGIEWIVIDEKINDGSLNGQSKSAVFKVPDQKYEFYRYVRIRQTGSSWYNCANCNMISLCKVEFYGKIEETNK